ncbi:hypothetical protein ACFSTC_61880 [Nonomuraea ferruginea]
MLRSYADKLGLGEAARKDAGRWYKAVAEYGHASSPETARLYADAVYEMLGLGLQARGVTVEPQEVTADRGDLAKARDLNAQAAVASPDYPLGRLGRRLLQQLPGVQPRDQLQHRPHRHPRHPGLLRGHDLLVPEPGRPGLGALRGQVVQRRHHPDGA